MPKKQLDPANDSEEEEEEDVYKVEAILQKRRSRGKTQYLIKWEGYAEDEATWEPVEHLEGAAQLLARFNEAKRGGDGGKSRSQEPSKGRASSSGAGPSADADGKSNAANVAESGVAAPEPSTSRNGGVSLPHGWKYKRLPNPGNGEQRAWVGRDLSPTRAYSASSWHLKSLAPELTP